jgi:hypothetical protein
MYIIVLFFYWLLVWFSLPSSFYPWWTYLIQVVIVANLISPPGRIGNVVKAGELIHEVKDRAIWYEPPACCFDVPNWREIIGKK